MSTSVTGTNGTSGTSSQNLFTKQSDALGRDAFLKLLLTQLQNQDPMNPMEDKEFISQLAQFSSLEQMQNMNSSLSGLSKYQSMMQASSMIGRTVDALDPVTGDAVQGKVESVKFDSGQVLLRVNDKDIPLEMVSGMS